MDSHNKLNQLFPHENTETCLITVKQEIAFDDETCVVKVEPEEEQINIFEGFSPTTPENLKVRKNRNLHEERNPKRSSRVLMQRTRKSYKEKSPESNVIIENMPKKRGRPRKPKPQKKSIKSVENENLSKIQKIETLETEHKEALRESSPTFDWFDGGGDTNDTSDNDFTSTKEDFVEEIVPNEETPAKPEIFAKCTLCPTAKKVQFKDEDDQKIHNELVHEVVNIINTGPYQCKSCPKNIASEIKMRRHIRQFHLFRNEKLCTTCGKTFHDRRAFYCHIDKNHGIRVRLLKTFRKSILHRTFLLFILERHMSDRRLRQNVQRVIKMTILFLIDH